MAAAADDSIFIAQAPAPSGRRLRVELRAGQRQVIDLQAGDVLDLVAQPGDLGYQLTPEGYLITSRQGGEVLLRGLDGAGATATVTLADGSVLSVADIILAAEVIDLPPAAGPGAGPIGGPPAPASGGGNFSNLEIGPLVGLRDTGPLGFTPLGRLVPEPLFRIDGVLDDGAGAGGGVTPLSTPGFSVPVAASGFEDLPGGSVIAIPINFVPTPGSTGIVVITGLPPGVSLNVVGTPSTTIPGGIELTPAQAAALQIIALPPNSDRDFALTVTPVSLTPGAPPVIGPAQSIVITVDAVADPPLLGGPPASGPEDTPIGLGISAALTDTDGSETLSLVTISGVPSGASLSSGTDQGGGIWVIPASALAGLTITPPANFNGVFTLGLTVTSTETPLDGETDLTNNTATTTSSLVVTVTPVSDAPTLGPIGPASGFEDLGGGPIAVPVTLASSVAGETVTVVVTGVPAGVTLNAGTANGPGSFVLTPAQAAGLVITGLPANSDRDFTLTFTPVSQDGAAPPVTGAAVTALITVDAVADLPNLTAPATLSGAEDTPIALGIAASLVDTDGSEVLAIRVTGVPAGATLSAGSDLGGGVWELTPAQLAGLTITPPLNFNGPLTLGVTATATETFIDGETDLTNNVATRSTSIALNVTPVADPPTLTLPTSAQGFEDLGGGPIAIPITVVAGNPGETAFVVITGLPVGVTLNSAGTPTALVLGGLLFSAAQAAALQIVGLPADSDADFVLTVTPFAQDGAAPPIAGAAAALPVTIDAVADPVSVAASPASGNEDATIALAVTAGFGDNADGSETHVVRVTNVPAGAQLSAGANLGGGVWELTQAQLAGLTITPPPNFNGVITLGVTAVATETPSDAEITTANNTQSASTSLVLTIAPVSDIPTLGPIGPTSGLEDLGSGPIAIPVTVSPPAPGETVTIVVTGLPPGVTLSAGTPNGSGGIVLTPAQAATLSIVALPPNSDRDFTLTFTPVSQDGAAPPTNGTPVTAVITVDAVADPPLLGGPPASGPEDTPIGLGISAALRICELIDFSDDRRVASA